MAFKVSYKDAQQDFELIPQGYYEMYIKSAETAYTNSGTEYFQIRLQIRDDINQPCAKRQVSDRMWLSEKALLYTEKRANMLSKAAKLNDGNEYEDMSAWGRGLVGKFVKVRVRHSRATADYEPREEVSGYYESDAPAPIGDITGLKEALAAQAIKESPTFMQVNNDEELPF